MLAIHVSVDKTLLCLKKDTSIGIIKLIYVFINLFFLNRQHICKKTKATGLKLYLIVDNHGYVWDFWIYQDHQGNLIY